MRVYYEDSCTEDPLRPAARPLTYRLSSPSAGMAPAVAGPMQVVDSPLLRQQVDAQRLGMRHLKNENIRLKVGAASHDVHQKRSLAGTVQNFTVIGQEGGSRPLKLIRRV